MDNSPMSEEKPGCAASTARGCGHLIQGVLITIGTVFVVVGLCGGVAFSALSVGAVAGLFSISRIAEMAVPSARPAAETPVEQAARRELVSEPTLELRAVPSASTPIPVMPIGPAFDAICGVSGFDMTDPQLEAHVASFVGQSFENWQGWVYDVTHYGDTYDLLIAMEEPGGLFWNRDIVVENIPQDLAVALSIKDVITFSGHIAEIETTFDVACNPLYVDQFIVTQ